jgi:histone-lysine N-methyltransferase EZH2
MNAHTIFVKAQCSFKTPKGRCKRITVLTHPYCSHHTKQVFGLYLAPSQIKLAGLGLYTSRDIKKGEILGHYLGERLTTEQYNKRYAKADYGAYGMAVMRNLVFDARKTNSCLARYICDFTGSGKKPNVEYQGTKDVIEVVALRKIKAGEELLGDYGSDIRKAMGIEK